MRMSGHEIEMGKPEKKKMPCQWMRWDTRPRQGRRQACRASSQAVSGKGWRELEGFGPEDQIYQELMIQVNLLHAMGLRGQCSAVRYSSYVCMDV